MSATSNLDLTLQTVEVLQVDHFSNKGRNGRGRSWLVIYRDEDDHAWSIGLIEKPSNTASKRYSYAVYAYDPPLKGDISDPDYRGPVVGPKLLGHYEDFSRHDKVNDLLDNFSYPTYRSSPAFTMVQDVVIHMSGVHPPTS